MRSPRYIIILQLSMLVILSAASARADRAGAWDALRNLDIPQARQLFAEELKKTPKDAELLRGMIITAFFDLDHAPEADAISRLVDAHPADPYLLPIFEHVAGEMNEWTEQAALEEKIADGLIARGTPSMAYVGRSMKLTLQKEAALKPSPDVLKAMGFAPGCWIAGPFDNKSNISAYRSIPFEGKPLDTAGTAVGFQGINVGWTWIPGDRFADLTPQQALEDDSNVICQCRFLFDLPSENEILIILGGAFNYRIFVDGAKIGADPIYRNAVIREGYRVHLPKGVHEVTLIHSIEGLGYSFRLSVLDTAYAPIPGLRWPRYADVSYVDSLPAKGIHPIFNSFPEISADSANAPDYLFWKANLRIYNGYAREAIGELEKSFDAGALSPFETWILCRALYLNGEKLRANEILGALKTKAPTPFLQLALLNSTEENLEAMVNASADLAREYPGRYELEVMECYRPLFNKDVTGMISALRALSVKYPNASIIHLTLAGMYANIRDYTSALSEMALYAKATKKEFQEMKYRWLIDGALGKYEEAADVARQITQSRLGPWMIKNLATSLMLAGRTAEAVHLMDSMATLYPYGTGYLATLYTLHNQAGEYDQANDILRRIYRLKPSAQRPYQAIDSLHYDIPYDSIFGSADAMALWDTEPTEQEKAGTNSWRILDRIQKIVFKSGVVLSDIHWATVVCDQEKVEDLQEITMPVDPDDDADKILTARRLRKGQPPLSAVQSDNSLIFKDLRPGDAIEVRYRYWSQNGGDLWQHFWDSYMVRSGYYQRYWEYAVFTDRTDLTYKTIPSALEPAESNLGGFRKLSWKGEKLPGACLDLYFLPPLHDIMGTVYLSTVRDWQTINEWYASISEAILNENPRTDALADKLTAGMATDRDKLETLYKYVVLDIPYQVISFDYDASIPHKPDEVLINRWGDCKDKAHLLVKMLRRCGLSAWTTLVVTRDNGTQLPQPSFNFDHLIVGCLIDGDTLFVDPTGTPYPPGHSIYSGIAGQPYMSVGLPAGDSLVRLPDCQPEDWHWDKTLTLEPGQDGRYAFAYAGVFHNLQAGNQRQDTRNTPVSELAKRRQSAYIDSWGVDVTVDSVAVDSANTVDSVFVERAFGAVTLPIQTVGKTTIITLPNLTFLRKTMPTALVVNGTREFPVDLHSMVMHCHRTVELVIPADYGKPNLPPPLRINEESISFGSTHSWNAAARRLTLDFDIVIQDGIIDLNSFIALIKAVNERFDAPILFEKI